MKNTLSIAIILSLLLLGSCTWRTPSDEGRYGTGYTGSTNNTTGTGEDVLTGSENNEEEYTIEITQNGFSPSMLTINVGDTVKFVNMDTANHWPASAMHPTHRVYPGSDIQKCGTLEESTIFDACRGLGQNDTFTFTFREKGEWGYHDHLNPSLFGRIVVQ